MENKELPKRKNPRLKNYDYSKEGYYFVTICTHNRQSILGEIVGSDLNVQYVGSGLCARPRTQLSDIGISVEKSLLNLSSIYTGVSMDQYVMMPNHVHAIIVITRTSMDGNLTLQDIIGRFKSFTTSIYNKTNEVKGMILWQRSFYEHIIRNELELSDIREYIINNPLKWKEDKYFIG